MAANIKFPKRLILALTPTPLEPSPWLTSQCGGPRIFIKRDDLTGSVLSGNKVRKIEFSLAEAMHQKANVVITAGGIQSNHCRATALACARLGLKCHLILRGEPAHPPDGNLLLDHLAGATFTHLTREVYSTRQPEIAAELAQEYAAKGHRAYYIPVGASNAVGAWGYVRAYFEIRQQARRAGIKIDHIVSAVGSGGTTAGLIMGRALAGDKSRQIWGVNVCDDEATFINEIGRILDEMRTKYRLKVRDAQLPINILDGYVGEGYSIPYAAELELLSRYARAEGNVLDPVYTGKGLYGMQQEALKGRFGKKSTVVFIHTGGIFGLFPQRHVISDTLRNKQ